MAGFCLGNQGLELSCRYVDEEIIGAGRLGALFGVYSARYLGAQARAQSCKLELGRKGGIGEG